MTIEQLREKGYLIYESYRGSYVYGTYIEGVSDKDMVGIYIQPIEDILGFNQYIPQVQDEKGDCVYYEVGRFLELLQVNNPNILEILNTPEEFIIYKHPVFDIILKEKERFITKQCKNSFGGYATMQYRKAEGQNKMMNWEKEKVVRKTPLDFCYVIEGHSTISLKRWLDDMGYEQKFCGVVNIPNAKDMYALYYDYKAHSCFSDLVEEGEREDNKTLYKEQKMKVGLGYKGIEKLNEKGEPVSNAIRLSSIPKDRRVELVFYYNKDGYVQHCKDYNKYQNWLKNRNDARWVEVQNHQQKIDGKNLLHCMRLINMSIEIGQGKGVNVRRPEEEAKYLIEIRKGKHNLKTLLDKVKDKIKEMDNVFDNSNLPNEVERDFLNELLLKIRREHYGI